LRRQHGVAFAQGSEPIKIVASLDLSGPAGALGNDALLAYQLAIDIANKKGGVLNYPLVFEYQNNGTNPQRAVSQASALVQQSRAPALLLAPITSGATLAVTKTVSAKYKNTDVRCHLFGRRGDDAGFSILYVLDRPNHLHDGQGCSGEARLRGLDVTSSWPKFRFEKSQLDWLGISLMFARTI
jgi:hypothetical protein